MTIIERYHALTRLFRQNSNRGNHAVIAQLYDLKTELETQPRTVQEDLVLSGLYTLLELHQSAYETFKPHADPRNPKDIAKLYKLEQKAQSHGNTFALKDIRKTRTARAQPRLELRDFTEQEMENGITVFFINKPLIIFNKPIEDNESATIELPADTLPAQLPRIQAYLDWLADCRKLLITFYNK